MIAGMGGELIAQILSEAPWTKDPEKRLILQPMTTAPELRKWLGEQGYAIEQEKCAVADGKPYSVMQVTYDPQQAGQLMKEELYPYIGRLTGSMPEEKEYISKVIHQLSNRDSFNWDDVFDHGMRKIEHSPDCDCIEEKI